MARKSQPNSKSERPASVHLVKGTGRFVYTSDMIVCLIAAVLADRSFGGSLPTREAFATLCTMGYVDDGPGHWLVLSIHTHITRTVLYCS